MDAAPPPPPEDMDPTPESGPESDKKDTVVSQRGTLAGRWQALNRQLSRLPIIMMLASLLLGLSIVQLTFQIGNSVYRSVTWKQETRETLKQVKQLQRDVNILKDAERMASDPTYLEQLARCQGFVGGKEEVVVATSASSSPGENCSAVRLP